MAKFGIQVTGTKDLVKNTIMLKESISKRFSPALMLDLAKTGAAGARRKLEQHKWRGNVLLAGVFAKQTSGGNSEIRITRDAVWFESGVRRHPVSLTKQKNEPLITLAKQHGLYKTNKGKRRVLHVHTPRLNLSLAAQREIERNAPELARKAWLKTIKIKGG